MEPPDRTPGTLLLATAGWILCGVAAWLLLEDSLSRRGPTLTSTWGYIFGGAGLVCHAAAFVQSVQSWRGGGGVPVVALLYLALPALVAVLVVAWRGYGRYEEAQFFRDYPDAFRSDPAGDGIDVRDARGVWHVALSTCPHTAEEAAIWGGSWGREKGILELVSTGNEPFMRLHVAERRVECLPAGTSASPPAP